MQNRAGQTNNRYTHIHRIFVCFSFARNKEKPAIHRETERERGKKTFAYLQLINKLH